jgi:hypothetical protein
LKKITTRCDIFCNVIDNYGDIGVCMRHGWIRWKRCMRNDNDL